MSIRAIATALNRILRRSHVKFSVIGADRYYKAIDANNRANRMAKKAKTVLTGSKFTIAKTCSGKAGDEMVSRANIRMVKANKTTSKNAEYHLRQFIKRCLFVAVKRYTT
jgi:hypothetical protein